MIFICDIIIYPLIKKNKIQPCVFLSLNIVIVSKNLKKLTNKMCLYRNEKKNLHNILGVSVLGPVGTRPDRLKPVGTRSD